MSLEREQVNPYSEELKNAISQGLEAEQVVTKLSENPATNRYLLSEHRTGFIADGRTSQQRHQEEYEPNKQLLAQKIEKFRALFRGTELPNTIDQDELELIITLEELVKGKTFGRPHNDEQKIELSKLLEQSSISRDLQEIVQLVIDYNPDFTTLHYMATHEEGEIGMAQQLAMKTKQKNLDPQTVLDWFITHNLVGLSLATIQDSDELPRSVIQVSTANKKSNIDYAETIDNSNTASSKEHPYLNFKELMQVEFKKAFWDEIERDRTQQTA
jgi:hypothetical protein